MPRVVSPIAQFNGGEISPLALGRSDLKGFQSCCTVLENFLPALVGAATRRAGTLYLGQVKNPAARGWLKGFRYDDGRGYTFEFGNTAIRFWTEHGVLLSLGVPLEVPTAFTTSDLVDADGGFALHFAKSSDVVWVFSGKYFPARVERTDASTFALATFGNQQNVWGQFALDYRAFDDENVDQSKTVYVSATGTVGGTVTLTSVGFQFQPSDSGQGFRAWDRLTSTVPAWEPAKAVGAGAYRRVDNRVYLTAAGGTTGTKTPVHTQGARQDGDAGVLWQFNDAGQVTFILPVIGAPTNAVTATLVTPGIANIVGAGLATYRWARAAWRGQSHPTTGCIWRERMFTARGNRVWASVTGSYEDNRLVDDGGVQQPTSGMDLFLPAAVLWFAPQKNGLLIGTAEGTYRLVEQALGEVFGPLNYKLDGPQSDEPVARAEPALAGSSSLYLGATRLKAFAATYGIDGDGFQSVDQTKLADHILEPGGVQLAFQRFPDPVLWVVRADGQLACFTYNLVEGVFGWSRQRIAGDVGVDGFVESVAVCPDPSRLRDEVTVIVRRTINGATRRYVEAVMPRFNGRLQTVDQAHFLDSGIVLDAPGVITSIVGLDHLEGREVWMLYAGMVRGPFTVTAGEITGVPSRASGARYLIGLPFTSILETVPLEVGGDLGSAVGRSTTIPQAWTRFLESIGGWLGQVGGDMVEIEQRDTTDPMDEQIPLQTGVYIETLDDTASPIAQLRVEQRQPLPMTLLGLYPRLVVKGR